jgi:hypothetical protein
VTGMEGIEVCSKWNRKDVLKFNMRDEYSLDVCLL